MLGMDAGSPCLDTSKRHVSSNACPPPPPPTSTRSRRSIWTSATRSARSSRERIAPRAAEIDATGEYPWDIRRLLAEHDLLGLPFAEEHGGTGHRHADAADGASRRSRRRAPSSALILMVQELGTLPIQLFGSDELKAAPAAALRERRVVAGLRAVRARGRLGPGLDAHDAPSRDGDEWVINGTKNWITNAAIADFYVVFAVTDREERAARARSSSRRTGPGFSIGKLEHKLGHQGLADRLAGLRGRPRARPRTSSARWARASRVALGTLERTRLGAAAQAVGIAQGATDYADGYAQGAHRRSASRSTSSRRSSSSSPTWRPAPPPRASCSTRPARWPTATSPRPGQVHARWPSSSPPTPRCGSRSRPSRCSAATATSPSTRSSA